MKQLSVVPSSSETKYESFVIKKLFNDFSLLNLLSEERFKKLNNQTTRGRRNTEI